MALFGNKQPVVDAWQDASQRVLNPFRWATAAGNAADRFSNSIATTGFSLQGNGPTNLGRAFASALTPQTVAAAGRSQPMVFGASSDPYALENTPAGPVNPAQPKNTPQTKAAPVSRTTPTAPTARAAAPATPMGPRQSLGFFMGKEYFDPAELYNDQLAYLDTVYGTNLSRLRGNKKRQTETIEGQLTETLADYDKQEETGLGNIMGYYAGLGDLYQSSQESREGSFKGDVDKARTRTKTRAKETLDDYLRGVGEEEEELGRTYATSRDSIGNTVLSDIAERLALRDGARVGEVNLSPEDIAANNTFLANLKALEASPRFNPFRVGATGSVNPILEYLAARG